MTNFRGEPKQVGLAYWDELHPFSEAFENVSNQIQSIWLSRVVKVVNYDGALHSHSVVIKHE